MLIAIPPFMRTTKAKEAVIHIFQAYPEPLSLSDLYRYVTVSLPKTAYSTVFRIVLKLEQEGRIVRIDWRERGSRYEWADLPHHHHVICQICGTVIDIKDNDLNFDEAKISKATGFLIKYHSIELEGICKACLTAAMKPDHL